HQVVADRAAEPDSVGRASRGDPKLGGTSTSRPGSTSERRSGMTWLAMFYVALWGARLFGIRSVLRAPRFFGPAWCCDCEVTAGFYENEGRVLMRSLQTRVLMPLVPEAALGTLLSTRGHWLLAFVVEGVIAAV